MSISDLMEAMANAGAPMEAILLAVRAIEAKDAELAAREAEAAERRAKDAARANHRRALLTPDWEATRRTIFERDNWTCVYCGTTNADQWHCDHVVPLSRGGTSDVDNLATSCRSCNLSKGSLLIAEWRS